MAEKYKDNQVINLENNYRSSGAILLAAIEVIQQDTARPDRPFLATHAVGTKPVMRILSGAYDEAHWIVTELKRVRALSSSMIRLDDIAILIRSASLSRLIEAELARAGLPYRMVGGFRFFDRLEIKLILDYLRVISNPDNNDAVARIINVPSRKIGDATVKYLMEAAESSQRSLWQLLCEYDHGTCSDERVKSKRAKKGITSFVHVILIGQEVLERLGKSSTLVELIKCINEEIDLEGHLEKQKVGDLESRMANVEELLQQAEDFSQLSTEDDFLPAIAGLRQDKSTSSDLLARYLATIALSSETRLDEGEEPLDQVTISTIHGAKGLEWPVVFVPAVYNGSIPHSRSEDSDEERRLLYVAMTRAKALLYLSRPESDSRKEKTQPSVFTEDNAVKRLLDSRGPSLKHGDVQCMSRILGRQCPSEARVSDILEQIPSMEDDFAPLETNEIFHESRAYSGAATGRDSSHYAASTATMNTGFVTATSHLQNLGQQTLTSLDGNRKRPASPSKLQRDGCIQETTPCPSKIKAKGAIDSFFAPRGSSATGPAESRDSTDTPSRRVTSSSDVGKSKHAPSAPSNQYYPPSLPRDLSSHRPSARPNPKRPRVMSDDAEADHAKAYSFLSSPAEAADSGRDAAGEPSTGNAAHEKPMTRSDPPAASMGAQSHKGKRTLGIRRGMDGWDARASRGKSTIGMGGGRGG